MTANGMRIERGPSHETHSRTDHAHTLGKIAREPALRVRVPRAIRTGNAGASESCWARQNALQTDSEAVCTTLSQYDAATKSEGGESIEQWLRACGKLGRQSQPRRMAKPPIDAQIER
jgi:hypothetical protein